VQSNPSLSAKNEPHLLDDEAIARMEFPIIFTCSRKSDSYIQGRQFNQHLAMTKEMHHEFCQRT
jgi:hypothetical protein